MAASIQLKTGEVQVSGTVDNLRGTGTGALVMTEAHGRYAESAIRTNLFHASTGVAGVAPGTALSTTPPLILWNPPNSARVLSVVRLRVGYVSGTLGAGSLVYAYGAQTTAPTGGTELQPVSGLVAPTSGKGRAFQGSTLAVTPLIVAPAIAMGAFLATTAIQPFAVQDEVAGEIQVAPGFALAVQGVAAAGTSPLMLLALSYEEIPIQSAT
jgi:hypothetical protein